MDLNYWLFQIKSSDYQLENALKAGELNVYPVKSKRNKIQKGDKVIIWKAGKNGGCYALATATSAIGEWPYSKNELAYFTNTNDVEPNVKLKIEFNLWDHPLEKKLLSDNKIFDRFNDELPGFNYKITQKHFSIAEDLAKQSISRYNAQKDFIPIQKSSDHPLNLILFGPPGTGKTFTAISLAVAIIENKSLEKISRIDRSKLRLRFNEYMSEGQIGFVTFHDAYTYEDFVEGIKPQGENQNSENEIDDGIFKQLAFEAKRNMLETLMSHIPRTDIKISFNQLYKAFVQYIKSEQFKSFESRDKERVYLHRVGRNGDFILRKENTFNTDRIPKSKLKLVYENAESAEQFNQMLPHFQSMIGVVDISIFAGVFMEMKMFEAQYTKALTMIQQQGQAGDNTVETFDLGALTKEVKDQTKNYVLIIDEINRGDISKIFGELITLIEEDKREGNAEGLLVQLPYSKSYFCVPSNLYIIGTMNTTGESIDSLDFALRRRFDFLEMEPDPSIIKKVNKTNLVDGIDIVKMLKAINERIEVLLNRDFRIGHTYFLNVGNLADLKEVFLYKIIPLLRVYFKGDFLSMGLVLGKDFIKKKTIKNSNLFADFDPEIFESEDMEAFQLQSIQKLSKGAFIRIYDKKYNE